MARIRTIKPEFWTDEKLSLLDPLTRLVFLGLVSMADDAGRLVDNVKLLDGQLFPCTDDTCRDSLDTLARTGRIIRYRSDSGQELIQVANWHKHQRVDNPSKYNLPAPPETVAKLSIVSREDVAKVSPSDLRPSTPDHLPPSAGGKKTPNGKRPTALEVGEIISTTKGLAEKPLMGERRIAKKSVEERFDPPTARAVIAVGLHRYLKDDDYLLRDLTDALSAARSA
jgi:hypothetical protein